MLGGVPKFFDGTHHYFDINLQLIAHQPKPCWGERTKVRQHHPAQHINALPVPARYLKTYLQKFGNIICLLGVPHYPQNSSFSRLLCHIDLLGF
jgi:hypothetical protein